MRYLGILGLFIIGMLLISGCSSPLTPKLPASFCGALKTSYMKSFCLNATAYQADDPRVRGYYTDWDAAYADLDALQPTLVALNTTDASAWRAAMTAEQQKAAYDAYFNDTEAYAAGLDRMITDMGTLQQFLTQNKAYLDSQRIATQSDITTIATIKAVLRSNINFTKTNLDSMAMALSLSQQDQQDKQQLFDTLDKLLARLA